MTWTVQNLWLIPALPLLAAGLGALLKQRQRTLSASLAIGSMALAFLLACSAFVQTLGEHAERQVYNFTWFQFGESSLQLGWVLDPLTAAMLVMVTFVGALIFIYSVGYMAHDENFTRFFCFLSLFAAAMLGLVIANSLLLLFMCWEVVGLASYLLIGFWFHKPSAAAAAKKAFITTRVGDVFFFLGLLWLYAETGTLIFYDDGHGCLEAGTLAKSFLEPMRFMPLLGISLLIFVGAMGKSGQVPLHTWLPDAMEGPTPVSALIHAATMVAAGVFLVARVFPLMKPDWQAIVGPHALFSLQPPNATGVITWVGAITAIFAALVAVAQTDIKRILAYSTVSQLGFMFVGLGTGGPAVGMFHLLTHAFFKALLFLGAGSVIHGCHEEQDIRRMGGLRKLMPVTFATYAIGMMALSGFPLVTSGFWSKDEILHSAWLWEPSKWPFLLASCGALLTAFYMTRQMFYVFFGSSRSSRGNEALTSHAHDADGKSEPPHVGTYEAHESPPVMTLPLGVLASCAILLSLLGTPFWPWFHSYLSGHELHASTIGLDVFLTMLLSVVIFGSGVGLGYYFYGRKPISDATAPDPLERLQPAVFAVLRGKFYIDELYEISVNRFNAWCARVSRWLDENIWDGVVNAVSTCVLALSWLNRFIDEFVVNVGFDEACRRVRGGASFTSRLQNGQVQNYLRVIGLALAILLMFLIWGRQ